MMDIRLLFLMVIIVSLLAGYAGYPSLHQQTVSQLSLPMVDSSNPGATARVATACEFSSEQIDHLAARLAPTVIERLATSGLSGVSPDSKVAAQQREALEKSKVEQAQAFAHATQLIDQMIANRHVTPEGISDAQKLLQQTNQSDRGYQLMGRLAVAVNKGELTPVQAGMMPPEIAR